MMDERQAQELARMVRLKSRAWMDDDLYGAFLRNEIFGSVSLNVSVQSSPQGDCCVVRAHWEHMDETFESATEWDAFAEKIEGRMDLAALTYQGSSAQKERLHV